MYVFHILLIGYTYSLNSLVIHILIPVYFVSITGNYLLNEHAVPIEKYRKSCNAFFISIKQRKS